MPRRVSLFPLALRRTSPRPNRHRLFVYTTLAESIAHLFSRADQQDLCRRCYTTTTVVGTSRSGASGSCTPAGERRHPFVQGEAVNNPPEWTPAEPPQSGRRHGPGMEGGGVGGSRRRTAAAGVLSLQVRFFLVVLPARCRGITAWVGPCHGVCADTGSFPCFCLTLSMARCSIRMAFFAFPIPDGRIDAGMMLLLFFCVSSTSLLHYDYSSGGILFGGA